MKLACERCNGIINEYLDKYETTIRKLKGYNEDKFVLCEKCTKELDDFLYEKPKTFNDAEQSYLQSAT